MFDKYAEHIAHSTPDHAEQFAGFDRGDNANEMYEGETIIGRMRSESGAKVEIVHQWQCGLHDNECFFVRVNGDQVTPDYETAEEAKSVGRWWLDGCPQ